MRPEILAPAGDEASLTAALAAGADAVYLGLDEGFNARARATNFPLATLPDTVARVHQAGARLYITANTLVFEPELEAVEAVLAGALSAGVDAFIVQDPAVAMIARSLCADAELHASTQMTIASPRAAAFAKDLGCTRVVVPRELSVDDIRRFQAGTDVELEVFVHGALCMSWSGQCLTSEAWGGRSANRGQCAQSCRLPYDLVVDGEKRDLGELRYLLSPKDLLGAPFVGELAEIGVHSLKIEGRQKGPTYVSTAVATYRKAVDTPAAPLQADVDAMRVTYSRGFGDGFFGGSDHQRLVDGRFPKHRGRFVGTITSVGPWHVDVDGDGAVKAGDGVVLDGGHPEDPNEPGGPVFRVERIGPRQRLVFGRPGPDLARVAVGHRVWVTRDPVVEAAAAKLSAEAPEGRIPVDLVLSGVEGGTLGVSATAGHARAEARSEQALAPAHGEGLNAALLADKLAGFGGTPFRLGALDLRGLAPGLHLAPGALKGLRRQLVDALLPQIARGPSRDVARGAVARIRATLGADDAPDQAPVLVPLCRSDAQLDAVIAAGLPEVELDWMELVGLGKAFTRAKAAGLKVTVATLRVTRPEEEAFDRRIGTLGADAILVRHWAALEAWRGGETPLHGDFSLNVTNSLTARLLLRRGLTSLTASFDLDDTQLDAMLAATPRGRVTVMLYHRIPTFHTEHCVYAATLSEGRDWRTCGRPCEAKALSLRDVRGREHPVIVDASCRNTVFNHDVQSAALSVPRLLAAGVRRFRVQLVRETRAETTQVLTAHLALLRGELAPRDVVASLGLVPQLGVGAKMATIAG